MKSRILTSLLACVVGLHCVQHALGKDLPTSESEFLKQFETALKAKDRNALLSLCNTQGVSADMKSLQEDMIAEMLTNDVKVVKLLPLPADFQPTIEADGVRYASNVSVVGMLDVEFAREGNSTQMPYGKKDGVFYIAGTTEERFANPEAKSRMLNISVQGVAATGEGDTFTGSCVYSRGGKEFTETIHGRGNLSEAVRGDYVKSCTVQKISEKQAWIRLVISVEGKNIFDSQRIETKDPIIYKKQ